MNLPEKYTESMKMMLGDEYDSYIESFNDKRLYMDCVSITLKFQQRISLRYVRLS